MALEAVLSAVLEELASAAFRKIQEEVRLVGDVKKEVKGLTKNLRAIKAVLSDAEKKQLKQESVKAWLDELKDASYDIEDILDEWKTAMIELKTEGGHENALDFKKKVCFFFHLPCCGIKEIVLRHDIAVKIKEIKENLDEIAKRKNHFGLINLNKDDETERVESTSLVDVSNVYGRNDEANSLVNRLLSESSKPQEGPYILAIVGIGGMGKTTLAQVAYNDDRIITAFEKRIWVCVSDPFDECRIAKAIIEAIDGSTPNLERPQSLFERIQQSIVGKKFLLVLDDVWTEDSTQWESFYLCLKGNCVGSKILITTRKEIVAKTVKSNGPVNMERLSNDSSWSMFEQIAFYDWSRDECEDLKEVGEKIVEKCKGLPLAIKVIASLLRFKKTKSEWQSILNSEIWEIDELEKGIFFPLLLSYYDLPPMVKSCFLYFATYAKDWKLHKYELINLWMAQGYLGLDQEKDLEVKGEDCFNTLLSRSLIIQEVKQAWEVPTVVMHDIIHDVALFLSQNQCLAVMEDNDFGKQKINEKIRHLMFGYSVSVKILFSSEVLNLKKLRSFIINRNFHRQTIPKEFFDQLTKLRALVLDGGRGEIPKEIGKLVHLRLLYLWDWQEIENLPDALCKLTNLQTLLCLRIKRVPEGIGKLINLRHLEFCLGESMDPMPKGIGRLTRLRTLKPFTACGDNIACLKNFIHLRYVEIIVCEDVQDMREVEKAELGKKNDLLELTLWFKEETTTTTASENFLEAMRPPPNLETFRLQFYKGSSALPKWMMSLSTLKHLYFFKFQNLERLPPLGKLPNLESLGMFFMSKVERVSNEFLGVESTGAQSSSPKSIFPKLKSLSFACMDNWEKWDFGFMTKDEEDISIMPRLHTLEFCECKSLREVPEGLFRRRTLEKLMISSSSEILHKLYEEWSMRRQAATSTATN